MAIFDFSRGATLEQHSDHSVVLESGGPVQRRFFVSRAFDIQLGLVLEQQLDHFMSTGCL